MVELNVASEEEIQHELKRREVLRREKKIKDWIDELNVAYNVGRIDHINTETKNKGTSVEVTSFHIFLK